MGMAHPPADASGKALASRGNAHGAAGVYSFEIGTLTA
jgi:hypothetical protein